MKPLNPSLAFGLKTLSIVGAAVALAFLFNAARPQIPTQPQPPGPVVESPAPSGEISLEEAESLYREGRAVFLDARDPEEYAAGHIDGALSLSPIAFTREFPDMQARLEQKTVITYCDGELCELSYELAQQLTAAGVTDVRVFKNGWSLWKENLPTATGTESAPEATMGATFDTAPDADSRPDAAATASEEPTEAGAETPIADSDPVAEPAEAPAADSDSAAEPAETPAADFDSAVEPAETPAADSDPAAEPTETPVADSDSAAETTETPVADAEPMSENSTEVSADTETVAPDANLTIDTNASETP
jgi:rhodanese-related sulfurtransferase